MYQYRDYPITVDFRHINGVDENEYLNALDELENKVNALIIDGLQTSRIIEKVNHISILQNNSTAINHG